MNKITKKLKGVLELDVDSDGDQVLYLGSQVLADLFQELLKSGNLVTINYQISPGIIRSLDTDPGATKSLTGFARAAYYRTNYCDGGETTEYVKVGDKDLIDLFLKSLGHYLLLEVEFHDVDSYHMGMAEARKVAIEEIQSLKKTLEFHMKAPGLGDDAKQHLQTGLNTLTEASSEVNRSLERLERTRR